jgi:acyl carrier protein
MNNIPDEKEIFIRVSKIIADALRINPTKISLNSKIFDDLGAESLDIIDIRFRIEHEFGFKIYQDELIQALGEQLSAEDIKNKFTVGSVVALIGYRLQHEMKI